MPNETLKITEMKNLILLIMIASILSLNSCCQLSKGVPEKVTSSFIQKFPDAQNVKWEKENDKEWEAEFEMDGREYSANYNIDGTWLETEYAIKDIPAAIQATLDSEFAGFEIEESEISETPKGTLYEFELEKGEVEMEVQIDSNGKVINKEVSNDEDDGEDDSDDDDDDDYDNDHD